MFDNTPQDDGKQCIHIQCPHCMFCNHIWRDRPMDAEADIVITDLQYHELQALQYHFPLLCENCGKWIQVHARMMMAIFCIEPEDAELQRKH